MNWTREQFYMLILNRFRKPKHLTANETELWNLEQYRINQFNKRSRQSNITVPAPPKNYKTNPETRVERLTVGYIASCIGIPVKQLRKLPHVIDEKRRILLTKRDVRMPKGLTKEQKREWKLKRKRELNALQDKDAKRKRRRELYKHNRTREIERRKQWRKDNPGKCKETTKRHVDELSDKYIASLFDVSVSFIKANPELAEAKRDLIRAKRQLKQLT